MLHTSINSISLSELKNVRLVHLRAAFQHITSLFVCHVLLHCHCPTVGWKTSIQSPRALKKKSLVIKLYCFHTNVKHKANSSLTAPLNKFLIVMGLFPFSFLFFCFWNHPLLFSCVGWVVICCSQADLDVFWEPPEVLETTVVVFNLTCLWGWELLSWCLG